MPSYRTVVEGQNFVFEVDNEFQHINFYKTLYIDANTELEAEYRALDKIKYVLNDSGIPFEASAGYETLLIDEIEKVDKNNKNELIDSDIVWFFSDEEFLS